MGVRKVRHANKRKKPPFVIVIILFIQIAIFTMNLKKKKMII